MAIQWRWRRKSDGALLCKIQVTHVLDREQLARALLRKVLPVTDADCTEMSKAAIEQAIRDQLAVNYDAINWVQDEYSEDYDRELTYDQALAWASGQVAKL